VLAGVPLRLPVFFFPDSISVCLIPVIFKFIMYALKLIHFGFMFIELIFPIHPPPLKYLKIHTIIKVIVFAMWGHMATPLKTQDI